MLIPETVHHYTLCVLDESSREGEMKTRALTAVAKVALCHAKARCYLELGVVVALVAILGEAAFAVLLS